MILDSDPIYEKLDRWLDNDEFDSVISGVLEIPREQWSVKLHFRLISAYNNKKDFAAAAEELAKIRPLCEKPCDLARFYYMNGYIHFMNDREMLAFAFYKLGLEADPQNTSGLELEKECRECLDYIEDDLSELHAASAEAAEKVRLRCIQNFDTTDMPDTSETNDITFAVRLGYLFSERILPGMTRGIGTDDAFREFGGEEREAAKRCLAECYGITSRGTMMEFFQKDRYCNLAFMVNDAVASLMGRPRFDVDILDISGRQVFENTVAFVRAFAEFLPKAGVLAWDINEKNGLLRYAYSCGILSRDDYVAAMTALSDAAKEHFSSADEYIRSLIFGCAVYAFDADHWNIRGAVDYLGKMTELLLNSSLPDIKWKQ